MNLFIRPRWKSNKIIHKYLSKFNQKSYQNLSKIVPKINPKSIKNQSKIDPKSALEPISLPRPFLVRSWSHFGSNLGPSWGPSWGHVGQKNDFWKFPKACKNDHDFQDPSGPSWDRFWNDFRVQNRTKIGPRSVSRAIMAQKHAFSFWPTKTNGFCTFFNLPEVEKRSTINKKSS